MQYQVHSSTLPHELWHSVAGFLDEDCVRSLCLVSKRFCLLMQPRLFWNYEQPTDCSLEPFMRVCVARPDLAAAVRKASVYDFVKLEDDDETTMFSRPKEKTSEWERKYDLELQRLRTEGWPTPIDADVDPYPVRDLALFCSLIPNVVHLILDLSATPFIGLFVLDDPRSGWKLPSSSLSQLRHLQLECDPEADGPDLRDLRPLIALSSLKTLQGFNIRGDDINSYDIDNDDMNSDEMISDEMNSDEMDSDEMNSDEMNSDEMNSDEMNSDEMDSDEMNSDEMNSDDMNSDDIKSDKGRSDTSKPLSMPRQLSIEHINLMCSIMTQDRLKELIEGCHTLKTFHLEYGKIDRSANCGCDVSILSSALLAHKASLESLTLQFGDYQSRYSYYNFELSGVMAISSFKCLRHIDLPAWTILPDTRNNDGDGKVGSKCISNLLPRSLQSLVLRSCDENTVTCLWWLLSNLDTLPNLKRIAASGVNDANLRGLDGFEEACNEKGIIGINGWDLLNSSDDSDLWSEMSDPISDSDPDLD